MQTATNNWQELCRFTDQSLARAVATSIAAMEFDVRLIEIEDPNQYVIEVDSDNFNALNDLLQEIVDEQIEFDALLEFNHATRGFRLDELLLGRTKSFLKRRGNFCTMQRSVK